MAKQKQPKNLELVDLNGIYQCNMVLKGTGTREEKVDVKIVPAADNLGYKIVAIEEDKYDEKYFYDLYLPWLFRTKYIVKKEG